VRAEGVLIQPRLGHFAGRAGSRGITVSSRRLPFLATKIVSPRLTGLVERPRLLAILSELQRKRICVIKAPAGLGKTSLAAAWVEQLRQNGNSVAWLTIDSDDDDTTRFLLYVSQALKHACQGVGLGATELMLENSLIEPHAVLSSLINDLTDLENEVFFFLEDYHWLNDVRIHQCVAYFLGHAPSHCHLVITTRTEPALPLASFRAQNQLLEIDALDLRFDQQETQAFFDHNRPGALNLSDIHLLQRKTEGWPAALRIIASMPSQSGADLKEYVRNLSGSQRPLAAYLAEMLEGLPVEAVDFMLQTAILDRLSGPLCDAVTGTNSGRTILATLTQRQLLLMPLGTDGVWHRYHVLLADHLRHRLEAERGSGVSELHRRAAHWYASQELWTEAVQHAFEAGEPDQAIGWVKNCAMDLIKRGDLFTLLKWQRKFPDELLRRQPEVRLAIAWGLALALRFDAALQFATEIESDIAATNVRKNALICECQAIRAVAIALKDDSNGALPLAEDCINRSQDSWTANVASNVLRYGYMQAGDFKQFYATPWIPYSLEEDRRNVFASVYRRCLQGLAELRQIRLNAAEDHYREALRIAEQYVGSNSVAAALPTSLLAGLLYERGELDEAESLVIDRVPLINSATMLDCVRSSYFVLARLAVARVNIERAHTLLEQAEDHGISRDWGRLTSAATAEQVRLHLNGGRVEEGAACIDRLERLTRKYAAPRLCAWSEIQWDYKLARAHFLVQRDRPGEALSILRELQRETEAAHHRYFLIRVEIRLSSLQLRGGKAEEATNRFRRILTACASAGLYQIILDEGSFTSDLVYMVQQSGNLDKHLISYVDRLAADSTRAQKGPFAPTLKAQTLPALSTRETEILALIADGSSNKEIARILDIGPETVKSHLKNVFNKLGAEKRAQAVARAQSLGLVTTREAFGRTYFQRSTDPTNA
jgi:LuxR family maltose regulon positive regulatory protein